jgi:HEPN domain-containing protein
MSDPRPLSPIQWVEAARWLERARDDPNIVDVLLAQPTPSLFGLSLHCQQAAEKLAKAMLIAFGVRPPHIHDIGELAELVADVHASIGLEIKNLAQLTAWYISSRYPDIAIESLPGLDDIRLAAASLRQLCDRIATLAPQA